MSTRKHQIGMTLIELMVALAIGMFLMIGAMTVFMQSRTTFRITESVSRLQENARFALDTLEPDIRMAQYWGLTSRTATIAGRAGTATPMAAPPAGCGANWTIDLNNAVAATNGSAPWPWASCAGSFVNAASDTLVVRRVAENPLTDAQVTGSAANTVFVLSVRGGPAQGQLFKGAIPGGVDPAARELHQLMTNGYYVSTRSDLFGATVPSLRRKTLLAGGVIQDQEIMAGVEDMQIQFGVDTDPVGEVNRGAVDRYVNPNDPILDPLNAAFIDDAVIVAVRIWLRVRAERLEGGFTDDTNYVYADQNVAAINDNFRRMVVSKTIYLRNARPGA